MPSEEGKDVFARAVALFYCVNAVAASVSQKLEDICEYKITPVRMPCSSVVKEVFLLKALEAGAEAVVVITCPKGSCQFIDGNRRAQKRVERVQRMLDEIDTGGWRLSIHGARIENENEILSLIRRVFAPAAAGACGESGQDKNPVIIDGVTK